ncbi:MAG: exopolysaccharide transport family protein [Pseudomonadota bacterium]
MNTSHRNIGADAEVDFAHLLRALWNARIWIGLVVIATAMITYAGVNLISPKYRAETKILIESQESVFTGKPRNQEEDRALLDQQGVISQAQLLESADLARRVIGRFNLATVDEFNPAAGSLMADFFRAVGLASSNANETLSNKESQKILERFSDRLEVFQIEDSRVLVVRFWSEDPNLAAQIANGIIDEYFQIQAAAKRSNTKSAISLLEPEIERLEAEARAAQRRVAEFRSGADLLLGADNQTLSQQQLAELNSQLSAARARKSDAEAKAGLIRELLQSGSALETASDVLSSTFIQRLRERQVALRARIAELSTTLLPNHPEIKGLRSQLSDLEGQITAEARKIVRGFDSEAQLAEAQMDSLMTSLNELKAQAARSNEQGVRLGELERDAAVKTARLETLMGRFREVETRQTAEALPVDARRIASATPPAKSFSPRKKAITAGTTVAALLLCLGFVVSREFVTGQAFRPGALSQYGAGAYDTDYGPESVRGADSLEAGMRAAVDPGYDPRFDDDPYLDGHDDDRDGASVSRLDEAQADPLAKAISHLVRPFDECFQWLERQDLRCTIVSAREDAELAVDAALDLARETTDSGRSAIVIALQGDVDAIEAKARPGEIEGFSELLAGTASFSDVIYQDVASRAHIIPQGLRDFLLDDIDPEQFGFLADALTQTYDRVLVAIGPLGADLGTVDLLKEADSVVLGVEEGRDERWGLAAFETLTAHGFGQVYVTLAPGYGVQDDYDDAA